MIPSNLFAGERLFPSLDLSGGSPSACSGEAPPSRSPPSAPSSFEELKRGAIPVTFDVIHQSFADEVERRLRERLMAAGLIRRMLDYHLATGGKRLRALLPVWVCINLGRDAEIAFDVGVGLELLHNATLVHDDLQDGDTHRRGRPTVWRRWGESQAINAGDALIFEAFGCIARAASGAHLVAPTAVTSMRLVEGQAMEFQLQLPLDHPDALPITMEVWQAMARAKTGALFGLCLRAGAVAAGRSEAFAEAAARYGEGLGLLFQVQDDLLDLVGNKGRARPGSDLKEGKLSFPVVLAYAYAAPDESAPIRAVLNVPREHRTWDMVDEACEALNRCGALTATATWLEHAARAATEHPLSRLVPGCVDKFVAPVGHVLRARPAEEPAH
jgi:geranylgeranyl pyrophosphate synthase